MNGEFLNSGFCAEGMCVRPKKDIRKLNQEKGNNQLL